MHRFRRPVPPGWKIFIHPEGCLYHCNENMEDFDGCSRKIRVITQADLVHVETVEKFAKLAYSHACQHSSFPVNVDLVLELVHGETVTARYYFVNHENRCLFWLEDFDATVILRECSGVTELSHMRQFFGLMPDRV